MVSQEPGVCPDSTRKSVRKLSKEVHRFCRGIQEGWSNRRGALSKTCICVGASRQLESNDGDTGMALAYPSQKLTLDHRLLRMHLQACAIASALRLVWCPDPQPVARVYVATSKESLSLTKASETDFGITVATHHHHRTQRRPLPLPLPHCSLRFLHLRFPRLRHLSHLHFPQHCCRFQVIRGAFVWLFQICCLPEIPTPSFPVRRCPQSRVIWQSLHLDRAQWRRRPWLPHVPDDDIKLLLSPLVLSRDNLEAQAQ